MTLSSCEEAASEEMVYKAMDSSTQPATTLLLRTPRNANTSTTKTENLELDGDSITSFDILLEQQASLIEFQN